MGEVHHTFPRASPLEEYIPRSKLVYLVGKNKSAGAVTKSHVPSTKRQNMVNPRRVKCPRFFGKGAPPFGKCFSQKGIPYIVAYAS